MLCVFFFGGVGEGNYSCKGCSIRITFWNSVEQLWGRHQNFYVNRYVQTYVLKHDIGKLYGGHWQEYLKNKNCVCFSGYAFFSLLVRFSPVQLWQHCPSLSLYPIFRAFSERFRFFLGHNIKRASRCWPMPNNGTETQCPALENKDLASCSVSFQATLCLELNAKFGML